MKKLILLAVCLLVALGFMTGVERYFSRFVPVREPSQEAAAFWLVVARTMFILAAGVLAITIFLGVRWAIRQKRRRRNSLRRGLTVTSRKYRAERWQGYFSGR